MAQRAAEFVGRAGRHGTEHGVGLAETPRRLEQAVQGLVHRAVAAHRHEAPGALGQRHPGEMRRVAQRLGEKRLEGAETPDELGLDRRPALAGAAFVGGGIDDDRDLRPFPMVVPYCQKLTGEGATLAGCHARNVCSTLFKSCAAIVIQ
jgi:hypothetical protein